MCGRFTLTADRGVVQDAIRIYDADPGVLEQMIPRYNVAPSQSIAAVTADTKGHRHLEFFKWGLIPSWAKDPKIGYKMINARSEGIEEKPSFRAALKKRRCLIPADGFFEWKRDGKVKTPIYIQLKSEEVFAFAGLYELWKPADSDTWVKSCTIITTAPNSLMEDIHDRMPVILKPDAYDRWLDPGEIDTAKVLPLLKPYSAEQMKAIRVSTMVNSPAVDTLECIVPL